MDERQNDYERWVQPIKRRMMQAVWRIVRDPDDAEDAFQQAMETIWRRWQRVRRHPNPPALMMTICVNAAYDQLRRSSRRAARQVSGLNLEDFACNGPLPDVQVSASETRAAIYGAIRRLPTRQRMAVSLRLLADLSYDAIAQALGCSEVTARTQCLRAMRKLQGQLADLRPAAREEAPHEARTH